MGTTANNVHLLGTGATQPSDLAPFCPTGALITPAVNGWFSVYEPDTAFGVPEWVATLSTELDVTVVSVWLFDSDQGEATLVVSGSIIDTIRVGWPHDFGRSPFDDALEYGFEGSAAELADAMGLDLEAVTARPDAAPLLIDDITTALEARGDLARWASHVPNVDRDAIRAAVEADPDAPFADAWLIAILHSFGIPRERTVMAHRFYERGESVEDASAFVVA